MNSIYVTDSIEISLEDNSSILVYFGNLFFGDAAGNAKDYLNDSNAVSAVGKLIYHLKNNRIPNYPTIETPLVTNIFYVGENLSELAKESYESGNTAFFSAVFPVLDTELQKEYCQRIYDDNQTAVFASVIPYMDRDWILLYANQSEQEMKMNFFSVIVPFLQPDELNQYAQKYYEANNIARFTMIVPYMTEHEKQEWLIRAQSDRKNTFSAVLSANLPE